MPTLQRKDFSAGYCPSDDEANGRDNALLRMDNLWLDDNGSVELTRGTTKINAAPFGSPPLYIYSKYIGGVKQRYVNAGGTVKRDSTDFSGATTVLSGGNPNHAAFGNGFGQIFIASGTKTTKDDGTTQRNWGIAAPGQAPGVNVQNQGRIDTTSGLYNSFTLIEGSGLTTDTNADIHWTTDNVTFRGVVQLVQSIDTTAYGGGNLATDDDTFQMSVRPGDTSHLLTTRVEFLLVAPGGGVNDVSDYYYFEWPNRDTTFYRQGISTWSSLTTTRGAFNRIGNDNTLNWSAVKGIRIIFVCDTATVVLATELIFRGGSKGPLNAGFGDFGPSYEYLQINVFNGGAYLGKSGPSSIAQGIQVSSGSVLLTPYITGIDSQVNECWFFRRGGTLGDFYFVGKCATGGTLTDSVTDETALLINIICNQFLAAVSTITEEILNILGPYFTRMITMTYKGLYIGDPLNPDAYDTRKSIITAFNVGEQNLFLAKVSNSTLVVGTTNDIYVISGTLADLPDGTLDINIVPLGVAQPPIGETFVVESNILYYIANDGVRILSGSESILLTGELMWLWKGQTRYGVSGFNIQGYNLVGYRLVGWKHKIGCLMYHLDSTASIFWYDIDKKYWYRGFTNPATLFCEEDGTLIASYSDGYLRKLDTGYTFDGVTNQPIFFRTTLSKDAIEQRKDTFVLKLSLDTGGSNVNVYVGTEKVAPTLIGTMSSTGLSEQFLQLSGTSVNLAKRFSLQIQDVGGAGVAYFRLTDYSIDVDLRPIPLPYLRIPPDQAAVFISQSVGAITQSTAGRKRITEIPFVMDTLSQNVTVTPILDTVPQGGQVVSNIDKGTLSYLFTSETYATDIGLIFQAAAGKYFEFYGLLPARVIDLLPDPVKFFRIPSSNLGTPSRKRIIHYAFVIDTHAQNVTFTPFVDSTGYAAKVFNTTQKTTVIYAFTVPNTGGEFGVIGIDIWGTLSGASTFEFYGENLQECITEKMPPPANIIVIPNTNLGNASRKRIIHFAFTINTRGQNVIFTPYIDNVAYPQKIYNTTTKTTVLYAFTGQNTGTDQGVVGTDIGGTLISQSASAIIEYYEVNLSECVTEKMPPQAETYIIPTSNFGVAARKRIRTIPIVINTFGKNVIFTPRVDGIDETQTTIFNTVNKRTGFHYFSHDSFGTDYGGSLVSQDGSSTFEFYEMLKPESVEILPVAKVFDQVGPVRLERIGKVIEFLVRLLSPESTMLYDIIADDVLVITGASFPTTPNTDSIWGPVKMPMGIQAKMLEIQLYTPNRLPFNRWHVEWKVNLSGGQSDAKIVKVK